MSEYYLSDGIKKWGPLTKEEIFNRVDSGQISLFDLVCEEGGKEFLPIMNHPDFTREDSDRPKKEYVHGLLSSGIDNDYTRTRLKGVMGDTSLEFEGLREKTRQHAESDNLDEEQWFTIVDGKEAGPFSFLKVVGLLASGQVHEYDFVKNGEKGNSQKIAEVAAFQPENLKKFKETELGPQIDKMTFRRAHERHQVGQKIFLFDRKKFYKVVCIEMSLGGAGVLTGKPLFELNAEIFLKFEADSNPQTFDAKGTIVSLRKVRVANREDRFCRYGIQFTGLSKEGEEFLLKFTS